MDNYLNRYLDLMTIRLESIEIGNTPRPVSEQSNNSRTALLNEISFCRTACLRSIINEPDTNLRRPRKATPLHLSVTKPKIAHFILSQGTNINAQDAEGNTPLHSAVKEECVETVCMLLCYNADANVLNAHYRSPFMEAVIRRQFNMQDVLFEYVANFGVRTSDGFSISELALIYQSPYLENILEKDAHTAIRASSLAGRLPPQPPHIFKIIWDRLIVSFNNPISIHSFINFKYMDRREMEIYVNIITQSYNTNVLVRTFPENTLTYFLLIYHSKRCDLNLLTKLVCLLLVNSYEISPYEIQLIFSYYGHCELFQILMCMKRPNFNVPDTAYYCRY